MDSAYVAERGPTRGYGKSVTDEWADVAVSIQRPQGPTYDDTREGAFHMIREAPLKNSHHPMTREVPQTVADPLACPVPRPRLPYNGTTAPRHDIGKDGSGLYPGGKRMREAPWNKTPTTSTLTPVPR